MEALLSIISGGLAGSLLVWLLRGWITERLKHSIQHEYAQKLETHKAELNASMQAVLFEHQKYQLRTSLFFDHQREAFAILLSQIAETKKKWLETVSEPEEGLTEPVPFKEYEKLKKLFYDNQLFLDSDCILAITFLLEAMSDSFPFDDGSGLLRHRDVSEPYERFAFLQDRMAELFQQKLGVGSSEIAKIEIAMLGAIRLLNRYHFAEIDLPVNGALKLDNRDIALDAVSKARSNEVELVAKLKELQKYLEKHGFFDEVRTQATRCLKILDNEDLVMKSAKQ